MITKKDLNEFLDRLDKQALEDERTLPDDKKESPDYYEGIWLTTRAIRMNFEMPDRI